jgi:hypothetical protein
VGAARIDVETSNSTLFNGPHVLLLRFTDSGSSSNGLKIHLEVSHGDAHQLCVDDLVIVRTVLTQHNWFTNLTREGRIRVIASGTSGDRALTRNANLMFGSGSKHHCQLSYDSHSRE